ncbi:hypothetical protein CBL_01102 [Carabus blaptoides fortunei]
MNGRGSVNYRGFKKHHGMARKDYKGTDIKNLANYLTDDSSAIDSIQQVQLKATIRRGEGVSGFANIQTGLWRSLVGGMSIDWKYLQSGRGLCSLSTKPAQCEADSSQDAKVLRTLPSTRRSAL